MHNKMDVWKYTIDKMQRQEMKSDSFLLELINYQYGYIGWCLGKNKKKEAKHYLELAENNVNKLDQKNTNQALANAYKSAFLGFRIELNPLKAPFLGRKSLKHIKTAIELDDSIPMVQIQYGLAYLHMPSISGGSKENAIDHFIKAENMMAKNPQLQKNDWNYIRLLTLLGQTYEEIENNIKAEEYYKKTLHIEPEYHWVKDRLYPDLKKNWNKSNE